MRRLVAFFTVGLGCLFAGSLWASTPVKVTIMGCVTGGVLVTEGTKAAFYSMITGHPNPDAEPGKPGAFYEVRVGERHDTHTVRATTPIIDLYGGKVSVCNETADRLIPIEEHRKKASK